MPRNGKFISLAQHSPHLLEEWDVEQNALHGLDPEFLSYGSGKNAQWICVEGHSWSARISSRTQGRGCVQCKPKNIVAQKGNSLASLKPDVAKMWHPIKNTMSINEVSPGSSQKVWWLCSEGHEYYREVKKQKTTLCPKCYENRPFQPGSSLEERYPHIAKQLHPTKNVFTASDVSYNSAKRAWWLGECGHEWEAVVYQRCRADINNSSSCPECAKKISRSRGEVELADYVSTLASEVKFSDRTLLDGQEVDIYLPDHKIAIEYNGLYWHSDKHQDKYYHAKKHQLALDKDVQLIQIWEDDWAANKELVKNLVAYKISSQQGVKLHARALKIDLVAYQQSADFLDENHIQGSARGTKYLALTDSGDIKAILVITLKDKSEQIWSIERYATSASVRGGFTKLLKYAETHFSIKMWVTFSDNCISDGGLYRNNGFTADKTLPPDYMYLIGGKRTHKFNLRVKNFKENPKLLFQKDMSETQLALLNDIPRIWDAGKVRWVKPVKNNQD